MTNRLDQPVGEYFSGLNGRLTQGSRLSTIVFVSGLAVSIQIGCSKDQEVAEHTASTESCIDQLETETDVDSGTDNHSTIVGGRDENLQPPAILETFGQEPADDAIAAIQTAIQALLANPQKGKSADWLSANSATDPAANTPFASAIDTSGKSSLNK